MKAYSLLLVLLTYLPLKGQQAATLINLPITTVDGYGPFRVGFSRFTPDQNDGSEWSNMQLPVKGIPKNWTNVEKAMARLNTGQLIYQNIVRGRVSQALYAGYEQNSKVAVDNAQFSKQPIRCYVYLLKGFDQNKGKWLVMVDTNNNLDFSDETPFEAETIKPGTVPDNISDARRVTYESYQQGKVVTARIPIVVKRMGNDLFFNFPQYARVSLRQADGQIDLVVTNDFNGLNYVGSTSIAQPSRWFWRTKIDNDDLTETVDVIVLNGQKYKNRGVSTFTNTLQLEALPANYVDYSLRTGRPFRPFAVPEFTTRKPVSLSSLKGKYVYIDFWNTGCVPCVSAMPALKKLYQGLDKNRFEFVGIVGNDRPERLQAFIQKNDIKWPQLLSTNKGGLIDQYHITAYPTTVLLDPAGNVVAVDLDVKKLEAKLNEVSR